ASLKLSSRFLGVGFTYVTNHTQLQPPATPPTYFFPLLKCCDSYFDQESVRALIGPPQEAAFEFRFLAFVPEKDPVKFVEMRPFAVHQAEYSGDEATWTWESGVGHRIEFMTTLLPDGIDREAELVVPK